MLRKLFQNVKEKSPLIHGITNYVTTRDCANVLLACGGAPIMAEAVEEVEEVTQICDGLYINLGTPNASKLEAMKKAGVRANALGHPVIFDPVGVGVSEFRKNAVRQLMKEVKCSVIRGNISEVKTLAFNQSNFRGVDANFQDQISEENLEEIVEFAKQFAKEVDAVVVITGRIDVVTDGEDTYCVYNGDSYLGKITGSGCQLSAVIGAYIAANPKDVLEATVAALCVVGVAGEIARERMKGLDGIGSFGVYLMDAISNMTAEELEMRARYKKV